MKRLDRLAALSAAGTLCVLLLLARVACSKTERRPLFEKVALAPFTVVAQPFEGSPPRADQDTIVRRLAEEATARAGRDILRRRIAGTVERLSAGSPLSTQVLVAGTILLPVSLPRQVIGTRAAFRKGRFATVMISVTNADGRRLAQQEVVLGWDDVWWTRGARVRRNRALDEVLLDFVRRGVDDAFKQLERASR